MNLGMFAGGGSSNNNSGQQLGDLLGSWWRLSAGNGFNSDNLPAVDPTATT
jgi:hypothetical protein